VTGIDVIVINGSPGAASRANIEGITVILLILHRPSHREYNQTFQIAILDRKTWAEYFAVFHEQSSREPHAALVPH